MPQNVDEKEPEGEQCELSEGDKWEDKRGIEIESDSGSEKDWVLETHFKKQQEIAEFGLNNLMATYRAELGKTAMFIGRNPRAHIYTKENNTSPLKRLLCLIDIEKCKKIWRDIDAEADQNNAHMFNYKISTKSICGSHLFER